MSKKVIADFETQKKQFLDKMNRANAREETNLFLIIVANVDDPHIGKGCSQDIESVRTIFKKLSDNMDFVVIDIVIQGASYSKQNVIDVVDALMPGDDDIVVFYYSGHGFRFVNDEGNKFPEVFLLPNLPSETSSIINDNSLLLTQIFDHVKGKGARLNLVIADCCNTGIKFKRKFAGGDPVIRQARHSQLEVINKDSCKGIFCDPRASIMVASADEDQFSITDDELGSIFTFNFTENLIKMLSNIPDHGEGLPWEKLLKETKEKTIDLSKTYDIGGGTPGNQRPIFKILSS
ncbi:MAG: caspase family protein [Ferruginibacter sp.]